MKKIGITETYDPCFVPIWDMKLLDANIIISKNLSDEMIDKLVANKDKVIFHHTVTGHGSTYVEPHVPSTEYSFMQVQKLIKRGFPISQYILRLDPIFSFHKTNDLSLKYCKVRTVLNLWSSLNPNGKIICRVSVLDMYDHVIKRFKESGIECPYETFHAPKTTFDEISDVLSDYLQNYDFLACAEKNFKEGVVKKTACVSLEDIEKLGFDKNDFSIELKGNRIGCGCLNKVNILGVKPCRCPHQCLYCYWKT